MSESGKSIRRLQTQRAYFDASLKHVVGLCAESGEEDLAVEAADAAGDDLYRLVAQQVADLLPGFVTRLGIRRSNRSERRRTPCGVNAITRHTPLGPRPGAPGGWPQSERAHRDVSKELMRPRPSAEARSASASVVLFLSCPMSNPPHKLPHRNQAVLKERVLGNEPLLHLLYCAANPRQNAKLSGQ